MDNKTLGIKILKSTALFTGKAVWFLLCKACLAVLLIMGFIVEAITSSKNIDDHEAGGINVPDVDLDPQSPHYLHDTNSYSK